MNEAKPDPNLLNEAARIIDPEGWAAFDKHQTAARRYLDIGGPVADELADWLIEISHEVTEAALSKASQVLVLVEGWSNSAQSRPVAMTPKSASAGSEPSAEGGAR